MRGLCVQSGESTPALSRSISAQVNLATRTASVRLQVKPGLVEKLVHGIKRAGYGARVIESLQDLSASSLSRNKALQNKRIVILALLFTIPVMVLGMSGIHSPWADYVRCSFRWWWYLVWGSHFLKMPSVCCPIEPPAWIR